jgi:hypothetical protein
MTLDNRIQEAIYSGVQVSHPRFDFYLRTFGLGERKWKVQVACLPIKRNLTVQDFDSLFVQKTRQLHKLRDYLAGHVHGLLIHPNKEPGRVSEALPQA